MIADPILILAWLLLAHLVADFVLQTDGIATRKFGDGPDAWRALGVHVAVVAALLVPVVLSFGIQGFLYATVTAIGHFAIDRAKIVLTRRAEPVTAGEDATAEEAATGPTFDRQWTAVPGALFVLDQLAHLALLAIAWALLLSSAVPLGFAAEAGRALAGTDPAGFHRTILGGVVLASLLIVNVRAASLLVATLVRPPRGPADATRPSAAKVGAVIGVLERLLICALVLAGAVASIALVIAAKTLARFKQLDDREFAEYYLLGTLASVTVAVSTSLLAQAVLAAG